MEWSILFGKKTAAENFGNFLLLEPGHRIQDGGHGDGFRQVFIQ
jgi:hypothetical protein